MSEKTLALGLNGEEIIEAVVEKIRAAMRKDCFLNPYSCYDWFRAKVDVHLTMNDCGRRPEAAFHVEHQGGAPEPIQTTQQQLEKACAFLLHYNEVAREMSHVEACERLREIFSEPAREIREAETALDVDAQPPNQVRVETNQPVPVLTQTPDGKQEIKRVSYRGAKGSRATEIPGATELETA